MGKARYILTFALWLGLGSVAYGQLMTFPQSPITITLPYDPVKKKLAYFTWLQHKD